MRKLTIVMAYYNNGDMLDAHINEWERYPADVKKNMRAVIVDDASPEKPAVDRVRNVGMNVEVFRVENDVPWHQDAARNLGMMRPSGWTLLSDMDRILPVECAQLLLSAPLEKGVAYLPAQYRLDGAAPKSKTGRHPNIYIVHRDDFWKTGGYDERLCGYYGTDSSFRRRLAGVVDFKPLDDIWLRYYRKFDLHDAGTRGEYRKDKYLMKNAPSNIKRIANKAAKPLHKPCNFKWARLK